MHFHKTDSSNIPQPEFQKELKRVQVLLIVVLSTMILVGVGASAYVYQIIYTSLSQVQEIVAQKSALSAAVIDFDRYDVVEQQWNEKYTTEPVTIQRDPFGGVEVAIIDGTTSGVVTER